MNHQEQEITRFNQLLDVALGISQVAEETRQAAGPSVQDLLEVAAALAATSFQDELRPAQTQRMRSTRMGRMAPARPGSASWRRVAFALLAVLALIAVAWLAIGPERALAALRGLLGYLPGVGLVDDSPGLRVLAEPVSQTREGVTVTIQQVVADAQRTVVVYTTDGLTIAAANSMGEGGPFGSTQSLLLPDGTVLLEVVNEAGYGGTPEPLVDGISPEGGWPNYTSRLVFPPVEADVEELTLVIPILETMPAGAAPEDWELTFRLRAAPADMALAPVTMLAPSSEPVASTVPETSPLSNVATRNGLTLRLDSVVELEDGFVLTGSLAWEDSAFPTGEGMISGSLLPTLTDATGQVIPIEEVGLDASYGEHEMPWSYRTNRTVLSGPLVLSVSTIDAVMFTSAIDFEIDLGPYPQIGQSWQVNRDFDFAGHAVRLVSLRLRQSPDTCSSSALEFTFTSEEAGIAVLVEDEAPQAPVEGACGGGGGGGGAAEPGLFYGLVTYGGIPNGSHRFSIGASIPYVIDGPWEITWQPPLVSGPTPTPEPEACLTLEGWRQLMGQSASLPTGVGGRIVVSVDAGWPTPEAEPSPSFPEVRVSRLDGSGVQTLVNGGWPALSPDGSRLIYTDQDGFHLLDLATGEDSLLGIDGYAPVWSPDGLRILYTSFPGLYVMQADGSGTWAVDVGGAEITPPAGWLPDGETIVYSVMTGEGFTFVLRNLRTGVTSQLFSVVNKWGFGAVSPDGQWIVSLDRVFGAEGYGVFVSRLDGSERRLLAAPGIPMSYRLLWSSDGRWLLVNTQDYSESQTVTTHRPVLIELATCRAVALPDVPGDVEGWIR